MLRTRIRFAVRRFLRRITPLTWLIWALLVADLSAPGYLRFNLVFAQVDVAKFAEQALSHMQTTISVGEGNAPDD